MEIPPCIEEMENIQNMFLEFIDNEENFELMNYRYFEKLNANEKCNKTIEIILMISNILDNHHRTTNFFTKILQIISYFREEIKQTFSNIEIFDLFCHNKRILLFLLKENVITINESIAFWLSNKKNVTYYEYFLYEILSFFNGEPINKNEENFIIFDEKRKIGENDNYLCKLIRNDQVEEFIAYVNKTNLSLSTVIQPSIFETNQFLIDKKPTLIEYSAFFGSIQIFRYLQMNKVELTSSLWIYAIHSNNADLIHLLEEYNVKPNDNKYNECFIESIKCNHIDFAKYIQNVYLSSQEDLKEFSNEIIKYRNYGLLSNNLNSPDVIYNFVKYNYPFIVDYLSKNMEIDINYRYVVETVQILAEREYDKDKLIEKIEHNLLHSAILHKNKEIVKILVANPKTNIKDKIIHTQAKSEQIKIDNYFPKRNTVHKETGNALHLATKMGNIDIVQTVLAHPDIDIDDILEEYDKEVVQTSGYNWKRFKLDELNVEKTPLHIALHNGYANIAQLYLSKKIVLKKEIKKGNLLIRNNYEKYILDEISPLYIAIQNGLNDIIKFLLLKCKCNVNANLIYSIDDEDEEDEDEAKTTALFASVDKENVEIVQFLLSFPDIDVNISTKNNKSPLYLAVEKGNIEIVKLLLTNEKINVNTYYIYKNFSYNEDIIEKKTPLYLAVEKDNIEMVKLLLSHSNIDINANRIYKHIIYNKISNKKEVKSKTMTILHLAVEKENIEMLKLILSNLKVDIENKCISTKAIINDDNEEIIEEEKATALQIALDQKNKEITKIFLGFKKYIFNPL